MLKIIGGRFKGAKLLLPDENITRPTSNRAREALFNCLFSLDFHTNAIHVIDGFAGSGAMGLEFLSRGAALCTFIEKAPSVQAILRSNIRKLKLEHQSLVLSNFDRATRPAHFIFLDPPYFEYTHEMPLYAYALEKLKKNYLPETLIVIETDKSEKLSISSLQLLFEKIYGTIKLSFFKPIFLKN